MLPDLTSPRLRLQPATGSDLDALWSLWTAPEVRRFLWDDVRISRDEAAAMLAECQEHQPHGLGLWTLRSREGGDGEIVGCAALLPAGAAAGYAPHMTGGIEPLVALRPAVWGRGYATEALETVVAYAFAELGLAELVAAVDVPNTASHALLARLGFVVAGESAGPRYPLRTYRLSSARAPAAEGADRGDR
jgi:RimJ/RimL family protein N-acetyltransferase